jgi:hypothetical protein
MCHQVAMDGPAMNAQSGRGRMDITTKKDTGMMDYRMASDGPQEHALV